MTPIHKPNEPCDLHAAIEAAALYVAGALPEEEARAFEAHLETGCTTCRQALTQHDTCVAALYAALPTTPVPGAVRDSLMARVEADAAGAGQPRGADAGAAEAQAVQVWKQWADDSAAEMLVRRSDAQDWEPTPIAGIAIRRLSVDRARNQTTMLIRMAPGTAYPRHIHDGPEECYVLQGDLEVGDLVLHAGDYQRVAPGSTHAVQRTRGGCLLLIMSSLTDELVA